MAKVKSKLRRGGVAQWGEQGEILDSWLLEKITQTLFLFLAFLEFGMG